MSENLGTSHIEVKEPNLTGSLWPLRHHERHQELHGAFGKGLYGVFAERVARSLGTPQFLIGQTFFLICWIALNGLVLHHSAAWDVYPFILLNLMLSFQAAYAAPLILVAENRQALRDKAQETADAHHRQEEFDKLNKLVIENTNLTDAIHTLTSAVHDSVCVNVYPRQDGDTIVLGPEIFVSADGKVICWKGQNYVPQPKPRARTARK